MSRHARLTALCFAPLLGLSACDVSFDHPREVWAPDDTPVASAQITADQTLADVACDGVERLRWHYTYDDQGRRLSASRYTGNAERPERVETRAFDDADRIIEARAEWPGGFVEVKLDRDPDGRVVRRTVDASDPQQQSVAEVIERTSSRQVVRFTGPVLLLDPYDPTSERNRQHAIRDAVQDPLVRGDAMIDALVRHIESGEPLEPLFAQFEVIETRLFDDDGRPIRFDWDLDGDGISERSERWNYRDRSMGMTVEKHEDWDGDDRADRVIHEDYDHQGRRIETRTDAPVDGTIDAVITEAWDDADRLIERSTLDGRGVLNYETRWVYEGDVVLSETDENGDGLIDQIAELHSRPDGQPLLKRRDLRADQVVDWQKRYVYDSDGFRAFDERDHNADGKVDQRWDYAWSPEGLLVHEIRTEPGSAACAGLGR